MSHKDREEPQGSLKTIAGKIQEKKYAAMVALPGGNPPTEASPDFAYEPCKGSRVAVGGECQMEEAAGLEPRSCPALVCKGDYNRRKCVDHTVDPGREKKPRAIQYMRATTAGHLELGPVH